MKAISNFFFKIEKKLHLWHRFNILSIMIMMIANFDSSTDLYSRNALERYRNRALKILKLVLCYEHVLAYSKYNGWKERP